MYIYGYILAPLLGLSKNKTKKKKFAHTRCNLFMYFKQLQFEHCDKNYANRAVMIDYDLVP